MKETNNKWKMYVGAILIGSATAFGGRAIDKLYKLTEGPEKQQTESINELKQSFKDASKAWDSKVDKTEFKEHVDEDKTCHKEIDNRVRRCESKLGLY